MRMPVPNVDLRPDHWAIVRSALRRHVPDREVLVFGSRATWTAKDYSDLDLAIMGKEPLTLHAASALSEALDESDLPFKVDLVDWSRIDDRFRTIIRQDAVTVQVPSEILESTGLVRRSLPVLTSSGVEGKWTDTTLGRLLSFSNGKASPVRSDGFPFRVYGSNGVIGLPEETNVDRNTIIIGRVGTYCGSLHYSDSSCWVTDNAIRARAIDENDAEFLFYLLQTLGLNQWMAGCGQPLLNQTILSSIAVAVPAPPEQRAIAYILGTLDDKIKLNRRMNETLEAMSRALFKSWFVDFDPVRAKMECRDTGLPQDITDLFPGRLVDSEVGEIPQDWTVSEIGKEINAVGGSTPSTKERSYWHRGQRYWATPKDLAKLWSPVLLETTRKITDAGLQRISSGTLPVGTVLLSSRAPIGCLAIAEVPTAVNQGFIAMKCEQRLPNLYVLFWCYENLGYIRAIAGGSTFAEISKKAFRPVPVLVPSEGILGMYERLSRPSYNRLVANMREAATLTSLRDTLLSKLISGEIRVAEAEKLVGART